MNRILFFILLLAFSFSNSCSKELAIVECPNGTFCPDGTKCLESGVDENGDPSFTCTNAGCGNNVVEVTNDEATSEDCDLGSFNSNAANADCRENCKFQDCGDGIIDDEKGEACDLGSDINTVHNATPEDPIPDVCRAFPNPDFNPDRPQDAPEHVCALPECGDGIRDLASNTGPQGAAAEECDEGDPDNPLIDGGLNGIGPEATCTSDCALAKCGDEIINSSIRDGYIDPTVEECDLGEANSDTADTCRTNCLNPYCGDGIRDYNSGTGPDGGAEECDEGNGNSDDPNSVCRTDCSLATCGDHITDTNTEECDEGEDNANERNQCRTDCTLPYCGDGILDINYGEECDTGVLGTVDGCSDNCEVESGWTCDPDTDPSFCQEGCGDGLIRGIEALEGHCDDGNELSSDGCSATCIIETGWLCDTSNTEVPSPCVPDCGDTIRVGPEDDPGRCDDGNTTPGDGCNGACYVEVGWICNSAEPTVCLPDCGDGRSRGFEQTAGFCDDGNNIPGDGCDENCVVETGWGCTTGNYDLPSSCNPTCGDGLIVHPYEECDGTNLDSKTCSSDWNFTHGTLQCTGCMFDFTLCVGTCGNGTKEDSEICDDGYTDACGTCNGSCTDWGSGSIPGDGQRCPETEECDTGVQGTVDGCSDTGTIDPGWECNTAVTPNVCNPICGDGQVLGGEVCDTGNLNGRTCTSEYGYTNPAGLLCNSTCDGFENPGNCDNTCPDGKLEPGETCDDGGTVPSDGCSAVCQIEDYWQCNTAVSPNVCTPICGDGHIRGAEASSTGCDDGNLIDNDGCTNCHVDPGYECTGEPSICNEKCGDGLKVGSEFCDLGVLNQPGDTCSTVYGYSNPAGLACNATCTGYTDSGCNYTCPDGHREPGEQCDDNNLLNTDGCTQFCATEPGWTCTENVLGLSTCTPDCGDSLRVGSETCDDGNTTSSDGCSNTCQEETGWTCTG
ncbi:MAG: DUF4215 domain-containing protein, partial [Deltaproteobacteria bacterium]|nr:DUF4215 domain-containing protein [Deltaproteobacteria bacterium]